MKFNYTCSANNNKTNMRIKATKMLKLENVLTIHDLISPQKLCT